MVYNYQMPIARVMEENRVDQSLDYMILHAVDESTHQILSYGLLFLIFYRFPYTAGPPTSTALT